MVRFHDAIDIAKSFSNERLSHFSRVFLIRDVIGRISVALNASSTELGDKITLSSDLHTQLGAFSSGHDNCVQTKEDQLFPEDVFDSDEIICIQNEPMQVFLVDRLINNQDWLRRPVIDKPPLPVAVAFSQKGGVGRSTTFAAWAHHLANEGYKVLAVDLDLEAPGLQSLLLHQDPQQPKHDRRPDFGVIDWLIESRVGQADQSFFEDMLGNVELPSGVPGEIRVVPAFGKSTADYVAKLGRAYLPVIDSNGKEHGFAESIKGLLETCQSRSEPFDVAILDARAGMHDIGAAAVTRLGAHAFLFARNDPQTWIAYQQLFEHLRFSPSIEYGMPDHDLRWRLSTVGAMVGGTDHDFEDLRGRSFSTWLGLYDEEEQPNPETPDETDQTMPHYPLTVFAVDELRHASFHDPDAAPALAVLERAYANFFEMATLRLLGFGE